MKAKAILLARLIGKRNRVEDLAGATPEEVVRELLERLHRVKRFPDGALDAVLAAILVREREATTGIGNGVAIPHMKACPYVKSISAVIGRSRAGVDFSATDGGKVHLFVLILIPPGAESDHIQVMKKVVRLSRDRKSMRFLVDAESFDKLPAILQEIDDEPA